MYGNVRHPQAHSPLLRTNRAIFVHAFCLFGIPGNQIYTRLKHLTLCQIRAFKLPFEVLSVETSSDYQSAACDIRVFVFRNREGHYCLVIRPMLWERKVWAEENPERVAVGSG